MEAVRRWTARGWPRWVDESTPSCVAPPGARMVLSISIWGRMWAPPDSQPCTCSIHDVSSYPKIGVYEPAGMRGRAAGGWNCHAFHANSEFYADYGRYGEPPAAVILPTVALAQSHADVVLALVGHGQVGLAVG